MLKLSHNVINSMYLRLVHILILFTSIFILSFASANHANINSRNILPPEKAFNMTVNTVDNNLLIDITIEPGYYLYQSKFLFNTKPIAILGNPQYSDSIVHSDEFFGQQKIFRDLVNISIPIKDKGHKVFQFDISLQGCADIGICYPPIERHYKIDNGILITLDKSVSKIKNYPSFIKKVVEQSNTNNISIDNTDKKFVLVPTKNTTTEETVSISYQKFFQTLLLFFLAGITMSLTACMYPLVPIISSIIVNQQQSQDRSFISTFTYTQGISLTYAILGIIAGLSGVLINAYMQQAIFMIPVGLLIILLGLSMLDIFQLQLPNKWQNLLSNTRIKTKNKYITLFFTGCVSALIIGPCIAPPLAFALGYINSTRDIVLGGLALYVMGLGMSLPLLIFSLLGDKFLPNLGNWMNIIKYLLGILLLFIGVYLMAPFIPNWFAVLLYCIIFILPIIILYWYPTKSFFGKIFYLAFSILGIYLTIYLISTFYSGKSNHISTFLSVNPIDTNTEISINRKYINVQELMKDIQIALENHPNQTIYLDFYADWCATCKKMEKYTFSDPKIKKILNRNNFFQIDITNNTKEHRELMQMFNVYTPPAFFVIKTPNIYSKPLLGFEEPDKFIKWIKKTEQQL
ncbi:MAG: protein-disulfide reductase DsbD [Neisseriaceae bacterium]|nr:MAG: protein-disulfide reductase DsbD [Neisseriaceae bacterium]